MRKLSIVLAVMALAGAACGGDGSDTTSGSGEKASTTQAQAEATTLSVEAVEPGPGRYAFTGIPQTVTGGLVEINLKNTGKEQHELQLVRFDAGHSADEVKAELDTPEGAPIPAWLHGAAGAGTAGPGAATTSKVVLGPGQYAFVCFISDDKEVEHYKNGMFGTFTVAGGDAAAALPRTEKTITAREYAFDLPPLRAGRSTIAFSNAGREIHHAIMFPIAQGKTFDDVKTFIASEGEPAGPPPVDFEKGTGTLIVDPGTSYVTDIDLAPGDYAVVCFINDRAGGPPHAAKGMVQQITVT